MGAGTVLAGVGLTSTGAYSSVSGSRESTLSVVSDTNGTVGLYTYAEVGKNSRNQLVDVTNNYSETVTITVTLSDCTQGTLYAPDGSSGCSVSTAIDPGVTRTWDIESNVGGNTIINYTVDGTSQSLDFTAARSTTAVNNATTAVQIKKFQLENGNPGAVDYTNDQFNVKSLRILDNDGDNDIVRRSFQVTDSNGNQVNLNTSQDDPDTSFAATGDYREGNITLQSDDNLTPGETYSITVTGYDRDDDGDGTHDNRSSNTKTA